MTAQGKTTRDDLRAGLLLPVLFLGLFWALEIVDQLLFQHGSGPGAQGLDTYGILPRETSGLLGILFAPFLHGGFGHLIANSLPFLILGTLVALRGRAAFIAITAVITVVAGLGVWLVGAKAYHIGASSLIFGYFGFLIAAAWFERSFWSFLVAVAVGFFYGGIIWGVLPGTPGISWEGHLFGGVGGGVAAGTLIKRARKRAA